MNADAANRREENFARIVSEVHSHVELTSPSEMARALCGAVPTELLAYITEQSEQTIQRWASGDVTDISQESERRLAAAYEILQLIDRFEAPGVAATWFIGIDPQLDFVMPAKAAGFSVVGYYFQSNVRDCMQHNTAREGTRRISSVGIYSTAKKLQLPSFTEGFDTLYYVRMDGAGGFTVEEWAEPAAPEPGI